MEKLIYTPPPQGEEAAEKELSTYISYMIY